MFKQIKALTTRITGQHYEQYACDYLTKQGLTLITRNVNFKAGEIDLIMQDGKQLVFVEVRYRASQQFGGALESVNFGKQQKIIKAAQLYLMREFQNQPPSCRFDVIAISGERKQLSVNWIKNAFA